MTIETLLLEGNKIVHKDQARLILSVLLNQNPLEIMLHLDFKVNDDIVNKYYKCLENIKIGLPLQYALNSTNFMGFNFYIDNRVLIPRFETEELVDNTNKYLKKYFQDNLKILDLCSGSGCIGLSLKKNNLNSDVTLVDISQDALDVSMINAKNLNINVKFLKSNLFQEVKEKYDVLISNPPYISFSDEVDEIVLKNEPKIALYANNNGLEFYDKILNSCENYLNNRFLIALEIGNSQRNEVLNIINKYLQDVKIICKKDMSDRDRMIFIFKNVNLDE